MLRARRRPLLLPILALAVGLVLLSTGAGRPAAAGTPPSPDDLLLSTADLPDGWVSTSRSLDTGFDDCPATDTVTPVLTDSRGFLRTGVQLTETLFHAYALFSRGEGPAAMAEVRDLLAACTAMTGPTGQTGPSGEPIERVIGPVEWEALGDESLAWQFVETGGYANAASLVLFIRRGDALTVLEYRAQSFGEPHPSVELMQTLARIATERLGGLSE